MNLTNKINSAEKAYKDLLESFFIRIYPDEKLISHGIDHHRRVWGYAKELLEVKAKEGFFFDRTFIQKLMIGCYLHDIGMSVNTGIKHGHHSRDICRRFLEEHNMKESDYEDILSAVENHDDKDYLNSGNQDILLEILSIADDLDAFGETGISRYLEIYKERGIENHELSKAILENAEKRFRNFERTFSRSPVLEEKHRARYNLLVGFFTTFDNLTIK